MGRSSAISHRMHFVVPLLVFMLMLGVAAPALAKTAAPEFTEVTVEDAIYAGKAVKPAVVVKDGDKVLAAGIDYTVKYQSNKAVGTGKVIISGIGAYDGQGAGSTFAIYGEPVWTAGATKMPLNATTTWKLENARIKRVAGSAVKVQGNVVTAVAKGTSKVAVYNMLGKKVATKTVKVYKLSGTWNLRIASAKGLYLDIADASADVGAAAVLAEATDSYSQAFKFKALADGTYRIKNANSKRYLQVPKGSQKNKAAVTQAKKANQLNQKWGITVDAKNRLSFVNAGSAKALTVVKSNVAAGGAAVQYTDKAKTYQKWVVSKATQQPETAEPVENASAADVRKLIATTAARVSYSRTVYQGEGTGTKYYMKVAKTLAKNNYYTTGKRQMRCNVPVAAAVRGSGADSSFPTSLADMYKYMQKSSKWKNLGNYNGKTSSLKPGDVLIRIQGTTTYISQKAETKGQKKKAETSHACVYVGKSIAQSVYKDYLKGTDADKGAPKASAVFVSGHTSVRNAAKRSASCLETAAAAYADYRTIVFRYVG